MEASAGDSGCLVTLQFLSACWLRASDAPKNFSSSVRSFVTKLVLKWQKVPRIKKAECSPVDCFHSEAFFKKHLMCLPFMPLAYFCVAVVLNMIIRLRFVVLRTALSWLHKQVPVLSLASLGAHSPPTPWG